MANTITAKELKCRIESGETLMIYDLRRQADFEADPELLPGAVRMDPAKAGEWAGGLPEDGRAVIYCARGGSISKSTQEALADQGHDVPYLEGGHAAWMNQGKGS
ncbi:rhodanese-like domain-containing protein [Fundidesulfovibrio terrae]|uniref:rhodanese-like domain-containing protein n=1 Tax=Fundidesulfovibrio terrae TaxID=2922866 RepID=UPI001FAF87BA|nr:rhodanese-like domain-containing protein [Fundidesulfovibrio terrae]